MRKVVVYMKIKKRFVNFIMYCMVISFTLNVNALAGSILGDSYVMENTKSNVEPTAAEIVWKYKIENGVVYKRQYNTATKEWIGDWIRV